MVYYPHLQQSRIRAGPVIMPASDSGRFYGHPVSPLANSRNDTPAW